MSGCCIFTLNRWLFRKWSNC